MDSTDVFMRVVFALKHSISSFLAHQPRFGPKKGINKSTATEGWALKEIFTRGGKALNNQYANREMVHLIKLNT